MMPGGNIGKHCRGVHKQPSRGLKVGDKPPWPMYVNHEDYIANPDDCIPLRSTGAFEEYFDAISNYTSVHAG